MNENNKANDTHLQIITDDITSFDNNKPSYETLNSNLKNKHKISSKSFKNEFQINEIEKYLIELVKDYNILSAEAVDDPFDEVDKIFLLKISEDVSFDEKMSMWSSISKKVQKYAKDKGMFDTLLNTAILVRR